MRVLISVLCLLLATPAIAQQSPCFERQFIRDRLKNTFQEIPVAGGMMKDGGMAEIYSSTSEDGETTWTFVVYPPGKQAACTVASGTNWLDYGDPEIVEEEGESQ